MNIGQEQDPIEVPIPVHPGEAPAAEPAPQSEPAKAPA